MKLKSGLCATLLTILSSSNLVAQDESPNIRINQLGFYPSQEKIAVWDNEKEADYIILDPSKQIIENSSTKQATLSRISNKTRQTIDLSKANKPGKYTLIADNDTIHFTVEENNLRSLSKVAIRSFYYQRTGIPILEKHAGKWKRGSAHHDTLVYIHPNAADENHKALETISSPGGWYDAGDYNKYIVNSAYSIGLMLTGYQLIPQYYKNLALNIPESGNSTPDLLNEMYFNLKWMLTMQDSFDGGVYHKLTTPNFEGFIAPNKCKQKRYVVAKSTAATLDFAAVMAQASRIYDKYEVDYPHFSKKALNAAIKAYEWAKQNPQLAYSQKKLNEKFKPAIKTGEYGDQKFNDEFFWAACELYIATHDKEYLNDIKKYMPDRFTNPTWGCVESLGTFSLLLNQNAEIEQIVNKLKGQLLTYAEQEVNKKNNSCFNTMFGNDATDFGWGALSEKCINPAISILIAAKLCDNTKLDDYLNNAFHNMDYILGRNATGYCYVTGFGAKSPMNIHHRLSASDKIKEPIPGFLAGGPNQHQQDKGQGVKYISNYADESYSDTLPSYASNEIAINWNASLVVLAGLLDAWSK